MTDQMKASVEAMAQADYKNTRKRMPERLPPWEELPLTGKVLAVKHSEIQHAAFLAHIDATGWQIVPKVPTKEMCVTGAKAIQEPHGSIALKMAVSAYRAMLAAAPRLGDL